MRVSESYHEAFQIVGKRYGRGRPRVDSDDLVCPTTNTPVEIYLTGRGKASDSPMTEALYNLGVVASKIMRHEVHDD
jgi:hypothetical protein